MSQIVTGDDDDDDEHDDEDDGDADDDDNDDAIFAGTGLLSVGSEFPGTVSPASRPSHAERTAAGPHEGTH